MLTANDKTAAVELVGEPLKERYPSGDAVFARNIWSLQSFGGKLYIGNGNSNNKGPAPNAGPVDVWYYEPVSNRFVKEYTAPDQQIDIFRVLGGQLVIPGHDPTESWLQGNFYRLATTGWEKVRTLTGGIHNYDMIAFDNQIFAALGTVLGGVIARSGDDGQTWKEFFALGSFRARSLFTLNGALCLSTSGNKFYEYTGDGFRSMPGAFFPGATHLDDLFMVRHVTFQGRLVYLGAYPPIDHNWIPVGMFAANAAGATQALEADGMLVRDLRVNGDTLFALGSQASSNQVLIRVLSTTDLVAWQEVVSFAAPTFARSFEILNGDFYFGFGCEADDLSAATGQILRWHRGAVQGM